MMTPKEKAKELFNKLYMAIPSDEMGKCDNAAKQCALIAVEEILKTNPYKARNYWQEVKKEIELL